MSWINPVIVYEDPCLSIALVRLPDDQHMVARLAVVELRHRDGKILRFVTLAAAKDHRLVLVERRAHQERPLAV